MNWFLWALGSAIFAALTAVLAKAGVEQVNPNFAMAIRTSVAMVFSWGLAWATMPTGGFSAVSPRAWVFLVFSGLATGLSWVCYFQALRVGLVSRVAPVDKLSVVLAAVLAVLFLGERLNARDMLGIALIVAGVVVMAWR